MGLHNSKRKISEQSFVLISFDIRENLKVFRLMLTRVQDYDGLLMILVKEISAGALELHEQGSVESPKWNTMSVDKYIFGNAVGRVRVEYFLYWPWNVNYKMLTYFQHCEIHLTRFKQAGRTL